MPHIDVKVEIWTRTHFTELTEEILAEVKDENTYFGEHDEFIEREFLYETEEEMTPSDNHAQATIEVWENDKLIWENVN